MDKLSFLQVIAAIAVLYQYCFSVFLLTVKTERKTRKQTICNVPYR